MKNSISLPNIFQRFEREKTLSEGVSSVSYLLYTIWLFGYEQLFDVAIPCSMFGIAAALSKDALNLPNIPIFEVIFRLPHVVLWLWCVVLQCCIQNQRHVNSINEDAINKPWRPLPAGRISIKHANYLLLFVIGISGAYSYYLGLLPLFYLYTMLVIAYNDLGGSDHSGFSRALLNGAGFFCFYYGSLHIALGPHQFMNESCHRWIEMMVLIFATTIHSQDFRDQKGDHARGRKTFITAIGETGARWSVALAVIGWSVGVPIWFGAGWKGMVVPCLLGSVVVGLTLMGLLRKDIRLDTIMYRFWGVWMLWFALMPLYLRCVV